MEEFIAGDDVDKVLEELQEHLQKYKFMESSKRQSMRTYKQKIPEIKKALDVVNLLIEQRVLMLCLFVQLIER